MLGSSRPIQLRDRSGQNRLSVLIHGRELEGMVSLLAAKGDSITRPDNADEPAAQLAQAAGLAGNTGKQAHLEHAMGDYTRQTHRAGELVVEVNRVAIARRRGVRGDLLP